VERGSGVRLLMVETGGLGWHETGYGLNVLDSGLVL